MYLQSYTGKNKKSSKQSFAQETYKEILKTYSNYIRYYIGMCCRTDIM